MEDEQSGRSVGTFTDDGMDIPEYVDYISLLYHLVCTTFIIGSYGQFGHFNNSQDQIIA